LGCNRERKSSSEGGGVEEKEYGYGEEVRKDEGRGR